MVGTVTTQHMMCKGNRLFSTPTEAMQKCGSSVTKPDVSREDKTLDFSVLAPNPKMWTQIIYLKHCVGQTKHFCGPDVGCPFNNL